jgi:hypothetical protein
MPPPGHSVPSELLDSDSVGSSLVKTLYELGADPEVVLAADKAAMEVFVDPGPSDIESVHTSEETKLFRVTGTVLRPPSWGSISATLEVDNPVFLRDEQGKSIGSARVYFQDDLILADSVFDYQTPERLLIENQEPYYYHAVMDVFMEPLGAEETVLRVRIHALYLTPQANYLGPVTVQS